MGELDKIKISNPFSKWKLWGTLAGLFLLASYVLGGYSVVQKSGYFSLMSLVLEYAAVVLSLLLILSFTYAWWKKIVHFPRFLTKKFVISSIPLVIVLYINTSLFINDTFKVFGMLLYPSVLIDWYLLVLYMHAISPFKLLLDSLGLWAGGGLFLISGPTVLGSYFVAVIYSGALYLLWTIVVYLFRWDVLTIKRFKG